MRRRDFIKAMGLGAGLVGLSRVGWAQETRRPNFVFFLIDDMGWTDLGCYGSTFYETPNIDRLAAQGVRFTNGYAACPVCSPTRASVMTGKYPARIGLTDWLVGKRAEKMLPAEYIDHMPLEEVTIAEALREAGYATGFVGKWHLGEEPYFPEKQGFDVNVAGDYSGAPPTYFYPYTSKTRRMNLPGGKEGEYLTDRLTDEALNYLDANSERPFLLYFSHYAVHNPQQAKPELVARYEAKAKTLPPLDGPERIPEGKVSSKMRQDNPVYAAMVHSVDESVGRVMAKLEELGVADNTVVIFMCDNGGLSTTEGSPTSNRPLRAGKGWLYEGGIREPLIVKWPGVAKAGTTCDVPVISTDFYPTMLEMTGLASRPEQHVDGVSFAPLLRGSGRIEREAIYWHYPHYGNQGGWPGGVVRAGDFKLIERYEDMGVELYNLKDDLSERKDLAASMPEKANELRGKLHAWREEVGANMPTPNPEWQE